MWATAKNIAMVTMPAITIWVVFHEPSGLHVVRLWMNLRNMVVWIIRYCFSWLSLTSSMKASSTSFNALTRVSLITSS